MRPRYLIATFIIIGVVGLPLRAAMAQQMGTTSLVGRAPTASEGGVRLGDDLSLRLGAGTEAGYDSNVYYQDGASQVSSSSILRVLGFAELTNAIHGEIPSGLYFDVTANLVYRQYFSDSVQPSDVRTAFIPTLGAYLELSSGQQIGLAIGDSFTRTEDPPYNPGAGPIVRNTNTGSVQLRWSPGGGRLQGLLRYTNVVEVFEKTALQDYTYGNSMSHELMLDGSWRWFPKTALYLNVRQGYVSYFNPSTDPMNPKVSSLPFHVTVGLRGLLTEKTSLSLGVGYTNGFYSSGPNPSGFGSLYASVDISYRPTLTTNLALGYQHDFQNSLLGNYYTLDGVRASLQQLLFGRLTFGASTLYQNRRFSNAPGPRTDNFFQVGASLDYQVKSWAYLGALYNLYSNDSNAATAMAGGGTASYVKHQVLGRIGVIF
jgi:Putative beta-barrel porin 2